MRHPRLRAARARSGLDEGLAHILRRPPLHSHSECRRAGAVAPNEAARQGRWRACGRGAPDRGSMRPAAPTCQRLSDRPCAEVDASHRVCPFGRARRSRRGGGPAPGRQGAAWRPGSVVTEGVGVPSAGTTSTGDAMRQRGKAPAPSSYTSGLRSDPGRGLDLRAFSSTGLDRPVDERQSDGDEFPPTREWPDLVSPVPSRAEATRPCPTSTSERPVADAWP